MHPVPTVIVLFWCEWVPIDFTHVLHDDVIKWKQFSRYWPFVRGIHRSPVNSPHKGQWRGALVFPLICTRIKGWVNNGEAGDLRRYRAHYDVIVMDDMDICITRIQWWCNDNKTKHNKTMWIYHGVYCRFIIHCGPTQLLYINIAVWTNANWSNSYKPDCN